MATRAPVRRVLLVGAALAIALPVLGSAQGPAQDEGAPTEVDLTVHGGRVAYTSCNHQHEVRYGGLGFEVRDAIEGVPVRAAVGMAAVDDTDEDAGSSEVGGSAGLLVQAGYDWEWLGFRVGLVGFLLPDGDGVQPGGFFPVTLRLGPRDGLSLRAGMADEVPVERGVLWAEIRYAELGTWELGAGIRARLEADAPSAYIVGLFGLGDGYRLGGRIELSMDEQHPGPQGMLLFGFDLDPQS
jgi:hypothetical protein